MVARSSVSCPNFAEPSSQAPMRAAVQKQPTPPLLTERTESRCFTLGSAAWLALPTRCAARPAAGCSAPPFQVYASRQPA